MPQNIWSLRSADRKNLSLIPHDLNYFRTRFVGKPMAQAWDPPPVKIAGKSLCLRDFVSWMIQAPVVSEQAKVSLEPILGQSVEFLPLLKLRKVQYFGVNVIQMVDCLNRQESQIVYSPDGPGRILNITAFRFDQSRLKPAPIFKVPDDDSSVFVMQPFVDRVITCRLTGAKFADPSANAWESVLRSESCNVVPGVLD